MTFFSHMCCHSWQDSQEPFFNKAMLIHTQQGCHKTAFTTLPHVLSLMKRFPGASFQQYNARLHTARVSQDCIRTVSTLPWPARSPDLSPIEYIWDNLGR
ncbi:transposable element Tcb2 transposase [Trichonephila clavipes]|nr:transposable element Tcb2 transposase [Trichonephila clavipes]